MRLFLLFCRCIHGKTLCLLLFNLPQAMLLSTSRSHPLKTRETVQYDFKAVRCAKNRWISGDWSQNPEIFQMQMNPKTSHTLSLSWNILERWVSYTHTCSVYKERSWEVSDLCGFMWLCEQGGMINQRSLLFTLLWRRELKVQFKLRCVVVSLGFLQFLLSLWMGRHFSWREFLVRCFALCSLW